MRRVTAAATFHETTPPHLSIGAASREGALISPGLKCMPRGCGWRELGPRGSFITRRGDFSRKGAKGGRRKEGRGWDGVHRVFRAVGVICGGTSSLRLPLSA